LTCSLSRSHNVEANERENSVNKIKSVHIERFRQFNDITIEVGAFNLLVGPNNCGKSTILHAIRAFFQLMHGYVRFDGSPETARYHKRFLTGAEEIAPTPDIKELWYEQKAGKPLTLSITFDDGITFGVSLRQQFGQIHVSTEALPSGLTAATVAGYLDTEVAFIPGLVGVLVAEPYATTARRNALATQGRYSEIFRSSMHQLKTKDAKLVDQINTWLDSLFGITVTEISFDAESDEYVTVKYRQGSMDFDVVSSGAGLQQVIQILTYLYLKQPRILLIDEPDAHLHSKLQARLGDLFRRVAKDLDAQVFLSTHSLDLIDTFTTNEVIVVDSSKSKIAPIGQNTDLVSALVDANVVDVSALSRLLSSRRLVVVEDKDQTILKALDKSCGSALYSSKSASYVLPAKGVGNFRSIADLGKVLAGLTGTCFEITFLQDRDGMPDFIVEPFHKAQEGEGVMAHLLKRHEIENYLLEPDLLVKAANLVGTTISADDVIAAMRSAAGDMKAEARQASLECAKLINRRIDHKLAEGELSVKVFKWFDALDLQSVEIIQDVFPGKELLPKVLAILSGKGKQITRGHCVASLQEDLVPPDIAAFFKSQAKVIPSALILKA
jgi:ABC-type cobalamin/Fe3+-siderophores transport system ATPase subunit